MEPFCPHKNGPWVPQKAPKMPNFGPKLPYLAISGSSCLKWVEHWLNTVEHCISHPGGSVGTFLPPEKWPSGAPEGPENAQFRPKIAIFGHKWFQLPGSGFKCSRCSTRRF